MRASAPLTTPLPFVSGSFLVSGVLLTTKYFLLRPLMLVLSPFVRYNEDVDKG